MKKFRTDAAVEADAARDVLHIRARLFAEIGHLVDEGDLGREKGVGGVFREFSRAPVGEEDRRLGEVERAVELAHYFTGALVLAADDHAVRPFEVVDGRALAQEFGVGGHGEFGLGRGAADDRLHLVRRAHGYGRFRHDHGIAR